MPCGIIDGMTTNLLQLRVGALRLALRPDLGGSIAGLWLGDLPVLRSTAAAALETSRLSGSFPMVPYSNRIGFQRFEWMGQSHTTTRNFDGNPHSLHGVAWQRPWAVVASSDTSVELLYRHEADAHWPFAFESRQRIDLTARSLTLHMDISNIDTRVQPAGLGWHPYFHKRAGSHLQVGLNGRWDSDAAGLPAHLLPQAPFDADVCALDVDNVFEGWPGHAQIRDEAVIVSLSSSLPYLVIFTPQNKPYFCVEPVSHISNAVQMADPAAHGVRALAPGARFEAWMKLDIAAVA